MAEVHELESYAEATKDAQWRASMEEEIRALDANETWDLGAKLPNWELSILMIFRL